MFAHSGLIRSESGPGAPQKAGNWAMVHTRVLLSARERERGGG